MKTLHSKIIVASIGLSLIAIAGVTSAYTSPESAYPANSQTPIDTSASIQSKTGGLSVDAFIARGNTQFIQNATLEGSVQQDPNITTDVVNVGTDTEASGEIHTTQYLNSKTLAHSDATPKPLCTGNDGNIVFCD